MTDWRSNLYEPDKPLFLPSDLRTWLSEHHLAFLISDVVGDLDLGKITSQYDRCQGGQPSYHPAMMLKDLFHSFAIHGMPEVGLEDGLEQFSDG